MIGCNQIVTIGIFQGRRWNNSIKNNQPGLIWRKIPEDQTATSKELLPTEKALRGFDYTVRDSAARDIATSCILMMALSCFSRSAHSFPASSA